MVPSIRHPCRSSVRRIFKHDHDAPTAVASITEDSVGHHSGRDLVLLVEHEDYQILRKLRGYDYQQQSIFTDEILPQVRCRACCRGEVSNPRPMKMTTGECRGISLQLPQAEPCVLWRLERFPQKAEICVDRNGGLYAGSGFGMAIGFPNLLGVEIKRASRCRGIRRYDWLVLLAIPPHELAVSPLPLSILPVLVGLPAICRQVSPLRLGEIRPVRSSRATMGV